MRRRLAEMERENAALRAQRTQNSQREFAVQSNPENQRSDENQRRTAGATGSRPPRNFGSVARTLDFANTGVGTITPVTLPRSVLQQFQTNPTVVQPQFQEHAGIPNLNNVDNANFMLYVMQEIRKLNEQLVRVPGVPKPMEQADPESYADSPFVDRITAMEVPKEFKMPNMKPYDGTTDPQEHIAGYKQKMQIISGSSDSREAQMCKGFGSTLTGPALIWFTGVPNGTWNSFADLVNSFNVQFASSRKVEKLTSDLFRIYQRPEESIRAYLNRFNKEKISIPNCHSATAVEAFKQGLSSKNTKLFSDLTMYSCDSFEDAQLKALAHAKLEDTMNPQEDQNDGQRSRRSGSNRHNNSRASPYARPPHYVNSVSDNPKYEYPDISTYNFSVSISDLVQKLDTLGNTVRWPRKNENPSRSRDSSKWCHFHDEIGHNTEDCIALKREVAYLMKTGHLKELIKTHGTGQRNRNPEPTANTGKQAEKLPPPPPAYERVSYMISGGSETCGVTYSAAKKHYNERGPKKPSPEVCPIIFDQSDIDNVSGGHHDGLVVTMIIGSTKTFRVLIDGGSSVNIIWTSCLKDMGIGEEHITHKSSVLVGFSGETKTTLGEISLTTYAEGVNSYEKYSVVDGPSPYNVLLGRPWIHNVKAVPSTFHQCVKIPSDWGVVTLRGEQNVAKKCYMTAMKPSKQAPQS